MQEHKSSLDLFSFRGIAPTTNGTSIKNLFPSVLFHIWFLPSSEWDIVREWGRSIMMEIPKFGFFCDFRTACSTADYCLPLFPWCIYAYLFPMRFDSTDDVFDILTVVYNMGAMPRTPFRWIGHYFHPNSLIETWKNLLHHLINLRVSTFASARKHIDICFGPPTLGIN